MKRRRKKLKSRISNLYTRIIVLIIFAIITLNRAKFEDLKTIAYDFLNVKQERVLENTNKNVFSYSDVLAYGLEYKGKAFESINSDLPFFSNEDYEKYSKESFESYSELDYLGRCGLAFANIGTDIMPTTERGSIGNVRPTGFKNKKYAGLVEGNYLYNRCHLIAYTLAGENDNPLNLITGTRYFNTEGMLPFEIKVANYVRETKNHVLYRVTPVYKENNLVADGVLMEAYSVEDKGDSICFCVYVFNVQPGIEIDYKTGDSREK